MEPILYKFVNLHGVFIRTIPAAVRDTGRVGAKPAAVDLFATRYTSRHWYQRIMLVIIITFFFLFSYFYFAIFMYAPCHYFNRIGFTLGPDGKIT